MIVTAMLAWYDEDPAILRRAVTSAACIADRVVVLDGKWDLYPGEDKASPYEQYEAIQQAAFDVGLELRIDEPCRVRTWTGQVAKRQHMLDLATEDADWVMPLDADWELEGDRVQIRHELEHTKADAIVVPFHTPPNPNAELDDVAATGWHKNMAGHTVHEPLIWRTLQGMRVENFHWCVYGTKNGQRVSLWGNEGHCPQADTWPLKAPFQINHWCLHRDQRTIQANRDYCRDRTAYVAVHGTEPL